MLLQPMTQRHPLKPIKIIPFISHYYGFVLLGNMVLMGNTFAVVVHPNILINTTELAAIKFKVVVESWESAFDKLVVHTDSALDLPLMSVTLGGTGNADNNCITMRHFCTLDPDNWHDSDNGSWPTGADIRDLYMAYAFTGDEQHTIKLT